MKTKIILFCLLVNIYLAAQQPMHMVYSNPVHSLLNADVFMKGSEMIVFGNNTNIPSHMVYFSINEAGEVISAKNIPSNDYIAAVMNMHALPNQEMAIIANIKIPVNFHSNTMIAKYNQSGNLLWSKYRMPVDWDWMDEVSNSSVVESNGSFVISGYWHSLPSSPAKRSSIIKISSNAAPEWARSISFGTETVSNQMIRSSSGGYILTGYLKTSDTSKKNLLFIKTDALGIPQTSKYYAANDDLVGVGIAELNDGSFVIAAEKTNVNSNKDIIFIRTDSSGYAVWVKGLEDLSNNNPDYPTSIVAAGASDFLIAGSTKSYAFTNSSTNAFLMKADSAGNLKWFVNYFDSLQTQNDIEVFGNKIKNIGDSVYILTGRKMFNQNVNQMMLVKTDTSGVADCYYQYQTDINLLNIVLTGNEFTPVVESPGFTMNSTSAPVGNYTITMQYPCQTPVELISFSGSVNDFKVKLQWSTATETSNRGFEIERSFNEAGWELIGFEEGMGTTTDIHDYEYIDEDIQPGSYNYRLKQIDYDGSWNYSSIIFVNVFEPKEYALAQNYPNPFNPVTTINYTIPSEGKVKIIVYDMLGNEVMRLVDENKNPGSYKIDFNASELSSGIYYYQLQAGDVIFTNKMLLLK